jgi:acyl carrier protein phosphodiesterase
MLGNLCGDVVKGSKFEGIHPSVEKGVRLHRSIDMFTDSHALVRKAKKIVRPKFNLFSGIVIDMFIDHHIAKHHKYLEKHSKYVYDSANKYSTKLPSSFKSLLFYMEKYRWLEAYKSEEGLTNIMYQMRRRIGGKSPLDEAVNILIANQKDFTNLFDEIWKDAKHEFLV